MFIFKANRKSLYNSVLLIYPMIIQLENSKQGYPSQSINSMLTHFLVEKSVICKVLILSDFVHNVTKR